MGVISLMDKIRFVTVFSIIIIFAGSALAHVGLVYPVGGENFNSGDQVTIQWQIIIDHGPCDWDLYFSDDGGNTWQEIAMNLPKSNLTYQWTVPNLSISTGRVRVDQDNVTGTDYSDQSGNFTISSTTIIQDNGNQPGVFVLNPAFPNPFNSTTTISFYTPRRMHVQVEVFDILGHSLATLTDGMMDAGNHQIRWNPIDIPSGVYFYQAKAEGISEIKRVTLVK
jgi:hypothetical protein